MKELTLSDIPEQHQQVASFMGIEKFIQFCIMFGGSNIYFPTIKTLKNFNRNDEIIELYYKHKKSVNEIARQYNISANYVRYILKKSLNND